MTVQPGDLVTIGRQGSKVYRLSTLRIGARQIDAELEPVPTSIHPQGSHRQRQVDWPVYKGHTLRPAPPAEPRPFVAGDLVTIGKGGRVWEIRETPAPGQDFIVCHIPAKVEGRDRRYSNYVARVASLRHCTEEDQ